ncbi:MAG: PEP-CTERM sorting domain-containing protein, partial [Burkholderiales bacterium]|nr:PEP-CTERM sorting domain-containing protein [Burkholderiales bacterium]
ACGTPNTPTGGNVPEPGSLGLVLTALAGTWAFRRTRVGVVVPALAAA